MKLTKAQQKMVIEYHAGACAEEMPVKGYDWDEWFKVMDKHWAHLVEALDRSYSEPQSAGWYELVDNMLSGLLLDRDPGGYLNSLGYEDTEAQRDSWKEHYDDMTGLGIDRIAR